MTREDRPESPAEKRNEYAYLAIPGAAAAVTYSLTLFHEIDFAVNEGYRKIPHGGIEEAGLLFGKIDAKGTRVEAFRPIACEHAAGPSFLLSDRDLAELNAQIERAPADPELVGLEVVGWFLAHTRSPLVLTDREADLCDHFFARPGMVTVLAKPERFQPTRFSFLLRNIDGSLPRDGAQNTIILPLSGRAVRGANGPIASIPAPAADASAARRPTEADIAAAAQAPVEEPPLPPPAAAPVMEAEPVATGAPPPPSADAATPSTATAPAVPAPNRSARRQQGRLSIEQVRPKEDAEEIHFGEANQSASADKPDDAPEVPLPLPSTRRGGELERVRQLGLAVAASQSAIALRPSQEVEEIEGIEVLNQRKPTSTTARLVMILPLAALLGCLVGYVAYLQVPSPLIPLSVRSRGENLIVTWPAEQTRSAVYAAVRVDDSTPVMLTPEEKTAGRVEVQARPDMKVELIARNWIHDSRGIVHYVKPVANTAP